MIILQLIGTGICLIGLLLSYYYYKREDLNRFELLIVIVICLGLQIIMIIPSSFDFVLKKLSLYRMMDLIMILAFIFIYIVGFYNFIKYRDLRQKLEQIVRDHALKDLPKMP